MKKILIIVGPTGSGKTKLALSLADKYGGELVSADSRQVYVGMDIGTGKDIPIGSKKEKTELGIKYFLNEIPLWGYDLSNPDTGFNVSDYVKAVLPIIEDIWQRGKLPILVGGTGLYVKALIDGIETCNIPVNEKLRENLENREVGELYELLAKLNPLHAANMNASDKKNPRRLIRAIEISQFLLDNPSHPKIEKISCASPLFVGLTLDREEIAKKITLRVKSRIDLGQKEEIQKLLKSGLNWNNQSMSSIGYRQWKDYFEGKAAEDEIIKLWIQEEKKYAKRQMTWFKKDGRVNWFDVASLQYPENVEKTVEKWYHQVDAKEN
jgi:tRNA dimethylallyltransferase